MSGRETERWHLERFENDWRRQQRLLYYSSSSSSNSATYDENLIIYTRDIECVCVCVRVCISCCFYYILFSFRKSKSQKFVRKFTPILLNCFRNGWFVWPKKKNEERRRGRGREKGRMRQPSVDSCVCMFWSLSLKTPPYGIISCVLYFFLLLLLLYCLVLCCRHRCC